MTPHVAVTGQHNSGPGRAPRLDEGTNGGGRHGGIVDRREGKGHGRIRHALQVVERHPQRTDLSAPATRIHDQHPGTPADFVRQRPGARSAHHHNGVAAPLGQGLDQAHGKGHAARIQQRLRRAHPHRGTGRQNDPRHRPRAGRVVPCPGHSAAPRAILRLGVTAHPPLTPAPSSPAANPRSRPGAHRERSPPPAPTRPAGHWAGSDCPHRWKTPRRPPAPPRAPGRRRT